MQPSNWLKTVRPDIAVRFRAMRDRAGYGDILKPASELAENPARAERGKVRIFRSEVRSFWVKGGQGRAPKSCRGASAPRFCNGPGRRSDNRRTTRPGLADSLQRY